MTLDIRAKVFCDKGPVISGGFSDDHVQGTGLIRTRGEVVLDGLVNLRPGDRIRLGYQRRNRVVRIPRALRVLSSFADPFRRQTTVSVGCKLTMLETLRENKQQIAAEDEENAGIPCEEFGKIPINISFTHIASTCIEALGLTVRGNLGLVGSAAIESFDYSAGYVQILSDVLYSQSKVGYLDASEALVVVDLSNIKGTTPVFDEDDVIDVSPIRSGDYPPDVVLVEYSYNRFKQPDPEVFSSVEQEKRNWELDITQGEAEYTYIRFNGGDSLYTAVHYPLSTSRTTYDKLDRVLRREERTTTHGAKINSAYVTEVLEETGAIRPNFGQAEETTVTEFIYKYSDEQLVQRPDDLAPCTYWYSTRREYNEDRDTQPVAQVQTRTASDLDLAGKINLPTFFYPDGELHPGNADFPVEITRIEFERDDAYLAQMERDRLGLSSSITYLQDSRADGITKTKTYRQLAYGLTQSGQQGIAKMAEDIDSVGAAAAILAAAAPLVNTGVSVETHYDRYYGVQKRPSLQERKKREFYKDPRESTNRTEYIYGADGVGITTSYNMPWAPDDRIAYQAGAAAPYLVEESEAPELARKFGRVQQRLTYGHRMGFAVQTVPHKLPPYGASLATLRLGGILAEYMVNGQSWSFDSNGIVASVDMVYLGGIGATTEEYRTPSPWAPVQDGITQLPIAPAVTTNADPAPANSIETPVDFDATAPGTIFDTLPTTTAPVYEKEVTVAALVPAFQEVVPTTFTTFVRSAVTRTLIFVPLEDRDVTAGVRLGALAESFVYEGRDAAPIIVVGNDAAHESLPDRLTTPTTYIGSAVEVETPVQFSLETTTAAPLAGASQTTTTPAGWTEVFSGSVNNDSVGATRWEMTGLPFDFVIDSTTYTSFWLYPSLTFGFGSNISFTTPSSTVPAQPKIHVYARRVQYIKKVYSKVTTNTYRVRVEATETSTSFPRVIEVAFFNPALFAGRTIVEVRVGVNGSTGDYFNVYDASSSLGAGLASKPNNSSYVFESLNGTGTSWSLTKDRHVLPVE